MPGAVIPGCTPNNIFNVEDPAQIAVLDAISSNYRNNYVYRSKSATANITGSMRLISVDGGENDDMDGVMRPTPHLARSPYIRQILAS